MNISIVQSICAVLIGFSVFASHGEAQEASDRVKEDPSPKALVQRVLRANDKNGDGKVARGEAVNQLKANFGKIDADGDGVIRPAELIALAKRMSSRQKDKDARIRSPDGSRNSDDVVLRTDIAYRDGNERWKLDLAMPKVSSSDPRPGLVMVHGGGWRSGDKGGGQWRSLPLDYAALGYVCISVNYRLTDEGTVLDCIADCKCAVRWFRAHAEEYNVDPERIGAYGNSAGAHLVSMLGLASADANLEGDGPYQDRSSLVQAVCCSATPSDFVNWINERGGKRGAATSVLFGDSEFDEVKRRASPTTYASDKAPPFLIIHGTGDTTVPVSQGDALDRALRDAGAEDVTYLKFKDAGHGVFFQHRQKTYPAMRDFFERSLRD